MTSAPERVSSAHQVTFERPVRFEALRALDAAVVDVSSRQPPFGLPRIATDHRAVGVLAAEHLLERQLHSLAFYGLNHQLWSTSRRDGFLEAVSRAGYSAEVLEVVSCGGHRRPSEAEQIETGRWLVSLPKPVGLMVSKDLYRPYVLDACQRFGLRVPDDVAIIGADDDTLLCEMNEPPPASVICNPEQIGYEAEALLDDLMGGRKAAHGYR